MNTTRSFTQLSKAWYGQARLADEAPITEEIMIGVYPEGLDEGSLGEFAITWQPLGKQQRSTPQLVAWDDAWVALQHCSDLLQGLAELNDDYATPEKIVELLISLGFQDATKTEQGQRY